MNIAQSINPDTRRIEAQERIYTPFMLVKAYKWKMNALAGHRRAHPAKPEKKQTALQQAIIKALHRQTLTMHTLYLAVNAILPVEKSHVSKYLSVMKMRGEVVSTGPYAKRVYSLA